MDGLSFRFGKGFGGALPLGSITDLFNGFNSAAGSYTGPPLIVPDNLGVLQNPLTANLMAIQGGRLSYNLAEGAALGPELIVNGGFDTDTWWVKNGSGVSISGGKCIFTAADVGQSILAAGVLVAGRTYRSSVQVDAISGVIGFRTGGTGVGPNASAPGTYTGISVASGSTDFYLRSAGAVTAQIDNISVREVLPIWLPTAADGSQLWPSQSIRTRKGNLKKYGTAYLGFLNEPARTNYFLNSEAPVTQTITTTAQQYTISVRGSGSITVSGTATGVATAASPLTVTATAGSMVCTVSGTLAHAQVEAGAFATSPIITAGATVTRSATVYTRPTAGALRPNDWGIWGRVVPEAAGQSGQYMFITRMDANSEASVLAQGGSASVTFNKKLAGVNNLLSPVFTAAVGTPYEYQVFQSSIYGMGVRVKPDGGAWGSWAAQNNAAGKSDAIIAATYQIGGLVTAPAAYFAGNFPFTLILQHMDPKTQLETLAARYP